MHTVIKGDLVNDFISPFSSQLAEAGSRILVHGPPQSTEEFCNLIRSKFELEGRSLHVTEMPDSVNLKWIKRVGLVEAIGMEWDFIVVLPPHSPISFTKSLALKNPECRLLYSGQQKDIALVASLPKSGTNLLSNLFKLMGYTVTGIGVDQARPTGGIPFADYLKQLPPKTCYFLHFLPVDFVDPMKFHFMDMTDTRPFLEEWAYSYEPQIFFNYRDPRAVISSVVHYHAKGEFTNRGKAKIYTDIIKSLPSHDDRLKFVIRSYPAFLNRAYREQTWLLYHPAICRLSFERLVGAPGGGDDMTQKRLVAEVMTSLSVTGSATDIAKGLFGSSRTFFRGTIDGWKSEFSPELQKEFEELHGDVLRQYGY